MRAALESLGIDQITSSAPARTPNPLAERIRVTNLAGLAKNG